MSEPRVCAKKGPRAGIRLPQNPALACQLFRRVGLAVRQSMPLARHHRHFILQPFLCHHVGPMLLALQQHHIQNIAFHQFQAGGWCWLSAPWAASRDPFQNRASIAAADSCQWSCWPQCSKSRPRQPETSARWLRPFAAFHPPAATGAHPHDSAANAGVPGSNRRTPRVPLQFLQGLGNRALGQKQSLCGLCEVLKPRHSQKNLQLLECHIIV